MALRQYFPPNLSADQETTVEKLEEFLKNGQQCFLLKGYAGTGKTFLVGGLIKYLEAVGIKSKIMAPTGRAAMIIRNKTNQESTTIHRAIYNFEELKYDDQSFKYYFGLKENIGTISEIFIVDESSMISDFHSEDEFFLFGSGYLLRDLISFVNFPNRPTAKIIFIGDNAQLPPIGMKFSPALDEQYLRDKYRISTTEFELKEVFRQQKKSGILKMATAIRTSLENAIYNRMDRFDHLEDVDRVNMDEFEKTYFPLVQGGLSPDTIIITQANRKAYDYNQLIRNKIFPGEQAVAIGDQLLVTKNSYNHLVPLFNGQFVSVMDRSMLPEPAKQVVFKVKGGNTVSISLEFRNIEIEVLSLDGKSHRINCKIIESFLTSKDARLTSEEQQALFVDFKNRHQHLKQNSPEFRDALIKDSYFNALQVKYGYAITCHKAQGGEWENVFLDYRTNMSKLSKGYFRWAYTGITRAKKHLFEIEAETLTPFSNMIIHPISILTTLSPERFYIPQNLNQDSVPIEFDREFLKAKYITISKLLRSQNVSIEVKHNSWVERYKFTEDENQVIIDLNYGGNGFTGKSRIISTNNPQFSENMLEVASGTPVFELEYSPQLPWQQELYEWMQQLTQNTGVEITNIIPIEFCERYFLSTDSEGTIIDFIYNQQGNYTHLNPKSLLGHQDVKLEELISNFN